MSALSLLTFNAGLLRVTACGVTVVEPAPFLEERFAALAPAIAATNADVVALQEVYTVAHRDRLVAALRPKYPYHARLDTLRWPNLGHGMLLFSRYALHEAAFLRFIDVDLVEQLFVAKGALLVSIAVPGFGETALAAVYVTTGGLVHTESRCANRMRTANLRQAVRALRARPAAHRVLLGDCNAGPEASAGNYHEILAAGFRDAVVGTAVAHQVTWDPRNPLNQHGPHAASPPQRVDHVFVDQTTQGHAATDEATFCFTAPTVPTPTGRVTLSDHAGVRVTLTV